MNGIFFLTVIFVFLTILVETINLILQLKGRRLTKWFGKNAFVLHVVITLILWLIAFSFIIILQCGEHPRFHNNIILKYIGLMLLILGLILVFWAFKIVGLKRSLCLNFFDENTPPVKDSSYKYIRNLEDYGLWIALVGLAISTGSAYNLFIAAEFAVFSIPHIILENKLLKK